MRWRVIAADAADMNAFDPGAPNFEDNAQNSVEQEVATKTWVDMALDLMSRGAGQQEVLAKLAHDGCPDPEAVYSRAVEHEANSANEFEPDAPEAAPQAVQPDDSPNYELPQGVTAAAPVPPNAPQPAATDPSQYVHPAPAEGHMGVQGVDDLKRRLMEAESAGDTVTAQQLRDQLRTMWQGYTGSVKVANFVGRFRGMEFDNWGRLIVAVDTEHGPMQLDGEKAEPVPVSGASDKVTEIQKFIDSIPEAQPSDLLSTTARIEGLQQARAMVVAALGRSSDDDLEALITMRDATAGAIKRLTAAAREARTEGEQDYLASQQVYERGAVVAANGSVGGFDSPDLDAVVAQMVEDTASFDHVKAAREDAAILVSELPDLMVHDAAAIADLAYTQVMERTAGMEFDVREQVAQHFVEAVEGHRAKRARALVAEEMAHTASVSETPDNEGPAEALFI